VEPDTVDYEQYVERSRRRFKLIVVSMLVALLAALYLPWALVPSRALSSNVAAAISVIAGLLLLGVWAALLGKLGNPGDAAEPTAESRRAQLRSLMLVAGAIIALLLAFAGVSYSAGFIERDGLIGTGMLVFLMGVWLVRALFFRALRTSGVV
jgi:hypothetical protein